jgi:hypothetical protein
VVVLTLTRDTTVVVVAVVVVTRTATFDLLGVATSARAALAAGTIAARAMAAEIPTLVMFVRSRAVLGAMKMGRQRGAAG